MTTALVFALLAAAPLSAAADSISDARDRQDRTALERAAAEQARAAAAKPDDAQAQYRLAEAQSLLAEVAFELRDKAAGATAAEAGIRAAERAVTLKPQVAEYHRVLGALCGQIIPNNVLRGLRYGKCARDSIEKAIQLDPKSARARLSRGVGNYYLPPAFGGGVEMAIEDFRTAIRLDPKLADAHLWLGVALRKAGHNAEARKEIAKSLELNPRRVWAKQQLEKTPAQ